jgi:hypothetical protein
MAQIDGTFLPGEGAVLAVQITIGQDLEDWLRQTGQMVPSPVSTQAQIDTGADDTIISTRIVTQLGLNSASKVLIVDVSGRQSIRQQ